MLTSLKDLNMAACDSVKSLPESELCCNLCIFLSERCLIAYVSHFEHFGLTVVPPMSEGFGGLSSLKDLDLCNCGNLKSLPASESHHSESFYFSFYDVRRFRAAGKPTKA